MRMSTLFRLFSVVMFLLVSVGWIGFGEGPIGSAALAEDGKPRGARRPAASKGPAASTAKKAVKVPTAPASDETAAKEVTPTKGSQVEDLDVKGSKTTYSNGYPPSRDEEGIQLESTIRQCREDREKIEEGLLKCNSKCRRNAKNCQEGAGGEGGIMGALLQAYAGSSTTSSVNCELTPDQWKTNERDLIERRDKAEDEVAKYNQEIVETENKTKKIIQELETEMIKAKKTGREDERKIDEQLRTADEKLLKEQMETDRSIEELIEKKSSTRAKMNDIYNKSRLNLMAMNNEAINRECTFKAEDRGRELKAKWAKTANSSGSAIAKSNKLKNIILVVRKECERDMYNKRQSDLDSSTNAVSALTSNLASFDKELERLEKKSKLLLKNINASADVLRAQKQEVGQDLMEFQGQKQKEAQDALDSYNKAEKNLKDQIKTAQGRAHQSQLQLNSLGLRPSVSRGTGGMTVADNYEDYLSALKKIPEFQGHCCKVTDYKSKFELFSAGDLCTKYREVDSILEDLSTSSESGAAR